MIAKLGKKGEKGEGRGGGEGEGGGEGRRGGGRGKGEWGMKEGWLVYIQVVFSKKFLFTYLFTFIFYIILYFIFFSGERRVLKKLGEGRRNVFCEKWPRVTVAI